MFEAEGIFTALVTSFARDGALDLDSIRESVRFQVAAGVRGVCALGGTGEPLAQTIDEQKQVIECVVAEADGGIGVIVGCLNASQPDIIEIGKHAKAAGADAIMVLPPYFVMATPHHVKRHLIDVAAAVDLPMILFNTPRRAGVDLEVAFILELLDAIPHLVAIKEVQCLPGRRRRPRARLAARHHAALPRDLCRAESGAAKAGIGNGRSKRRTDPATALRHPG